MSINWSAFTPETALAGGVLIGLASILLMALNGRLAGISGIIGNVLPWKPTESSWRLAFIVGLLSAGFGWQLFAPLPEINLQVSNNGTLILAGLLVGFGTSLSSGCTSGHGVCGLSRLSGRSLVATLSFMLAAVITVYITHHLLGA